MRWNPQEAIKRIAADLDRLTRKPRVMLVEDSWGDIELESSALAPFVSELMTLQTGSRAIEVLRAESFDLVFLDAAMPSMDGMTTLREIQKFKPDQKIVIVTGYADSQIVQSMLSEGALLVIEKPLKPEHLARLFKT